jgi:SIR2-like protein
MGQGPEPLVTANTVDAFPMKQVAEWFTAGSIIPFLGSAASFAGVRTTPRAPSGADLRDDLLRLIPQYPGTAEDPLAKVAQYYTFSIDRHALYEKLYDWLFTRQTDGEIAPTPRFLAKVPATGKRFVMVTTNYDTQVERAFKEAGRELLVLTQHVRDLETGPATLLVQYPSGNLEFDHTDVFTMPDSLSVDVPILYKMHGSVQWAATEDRDTLVITEDDYADFLTRCRPSHFPPNALSRMFKERRFLFLGYSLEDWNFRVMLRALALRQALTDSSGRRHYSIQHEPPLIDAALWEQRKVAIYSAELDVFIAELEEAMHLT